MVLVWRVTIDSDLASQRVMQVTVSGKAYDSARSACISNGGDLMTPDTTSRIAAVASAVNSSNGYIRNAPLYVYVSFLHLTFIVVHVYYQPLHSRPTHVN